MKKLLLTLGSAAAVVAPMATVVACGDSATSNVSYDSATETLSVTGITLWEDKGENNVAPLDALADEINVAPYNNAETIEMEIAWTAENADGKYIVAKAEMDVADIASELSLPATTTLKDFFALTHWEEEKNTDDKIEASKKGAPALALVRAITDQYLKDVAEAEAEAAIAAELADLKTAIAAITVESTLADASTLDGTLITDETAFETTFGLTTEEVAKVTGLFDADSTWSLAGLKADDDATEFTIVLSHGEVTEDEEVALKVNFDTTA